MKAVIPELLLAAAALAIAGQCVSADGPTGDFDGDGQDELLLRHADTGEWRYYTLADTGVNRH